MARPNKVESMMNRKSGENQADSTSTDPQNDLDSALKFVQSELGDLYSIAVFRKHNPTSLGFPILRPRWYATCLHYRIIGHR